jgi:hypothetical protein
MSSVAYYGTHVKMSPAPFAMDYGGSTAAAVTQIGAWLALAGWTASGGVPATATIQFPFGVGAEAYLSIDGISYTAVSGGTPGSPTLVGSAVTIPLGGDLFDTVTANLFAAAVTLFSQWNATVTMTGASSFTLNLAAQTGGTAANASVIVCNEAYCVLSTVPWGGSVQYLSAPSINGEQIGVGLAAYTPGYEGGVYLVVTTTYPGATPQPMTVCWCNCSGGWNFWADDYSMCLWMTGSVDVGVPNGRGFIYSGVSRDCRLDYYLGPPEYWPAFTTWDSLRTLLSQSGNGAAEMNGALYSAPSPFAVAVPNAGGYELDGKAAVNPIVGGLGSVPLVMQARLGLPYGGYMWLVGWLWDAIVVTAQYALGAFIGYDSKQWVCLLTQPGASLFLQTGAAAADSAVVPWPDECDAGSAPPTIPGGAAGIGNYAA